MQYVQFDYYPEEAADSGEEMADWWSHHWEKRQGLRGDLDCEPIWATISDVVAATATGTFLEAGCGVPIWVDYFEKLGFDAIGLDYAPSGLRVGHAANPALKLLRGDFRALPLPDDSVDLILSIGAIEHDINGPQRALDELCRVLKPTGYLMCSVPCLNVRRRVGYPWLVARDWLKRQELLRRLWGKTAPFKFYQYVWSPARYARMLEQSGFRLVDMRGYGVTARSTLAKTLDGPLNRLLPLYSPHMMTAICQKRG